MWTRVYLVTVLRDKLQWITSRQSNWSADRLLLNLLPIINKRGRTLTADQLAGVVGIKLPQIEEMLNSAESRFTAASLNDAKATHYIDR